MAKTSQPKIDLVRSVHPARPDYDFFLPKENPALIKDLLKKPVFQKECQKACSKTITLLPKRSVNGRTGHGYHMINVDGFRYLNAYVISEALRSTSDHGFSLEISFSVNDFVLGEGVIGETSYFFNFDTFYNPGENRQRTIRSATSDQASRGGLPWIGGTDLTHILRIPIMGPYVRATVFNEDGESRDVEVMGYLTT